MKNKISVIIPCYNSEKTIANTIDSILHQTYHDIEIIVVNDGSTDNTREIIEDYKKIYNKIKVFNNKNHGVSYSRNFGIENSKGYYISFVDADDTIDKDFYEKLVYNTAEKNLVGSQIKKKYADKNDIIIRNESCDNAKKVVKDLALGNIDGYTCRFLFEKSKLINTKFDESLSYMEDTYFLLNYMLNNNIEKITFVDTYYNYFQIPTSVTNKNGNVSKTIKSIKQSIDKIFSLSLIERNNDIKINKSNRKLKLYESQIFKINSKDEFKKVKSNTDIINDIRNQIKLKNTKTIYKIFYICFLNLPYPFFKIYKFLRATLKKAMIKL